jgi:MarR family transcriptional repressor of emrRAB
MDREQINLIEASLQRLSGRMDFVPIDEILLTRLVMFLSNDLSAMLEQFIRPFGLAEGEFRVLTALYSQPDGVANPTELCSRAVQSPANMSRICDALVSRDLITRDLSEQDRRKMVLTINDKGAQLVRDLLPSMFAALRESFGEFTSDEKKCLIDQIKRLAHSLEKVMASAAAVSNV